MANVHFDDRGGMARDGLQGWLDANRAKLGSSFEELFVKNVLSQIESFSFGSLSAQYPFRDQSGGRRYCDFVISEGESVRIAIEVDGYDKTGRGAGMSKMQWLDWLRRQNSFVAQGWVLLRFANADVRDNPEATAKIIELVLRDQRSKASHIQNLKDELVELEAQVEAADVGSREYSQLVLSLENAERELALADKSRELNSAERGEMDSILAHLSNQRIEHQKSIVWFVGLVLAALLFFVAVVLAERKELLESQRARALPEVASETSGANANGSSCASPLDWTDARSSVGADYAFKGNVVNVTRRSDVKGDPTWIEIGARYPDTRRLTAVIWGTNYPSVEPAIHDVAVGDLICINGRVGMHDNAAQISINSPHQIVKK